MKNFSFSGYGKLKICLLVLLISTSLGSVDVFAEENKGPKTSGDGNTATVPVQDDADKAIDIATKQLEGYFSGASKLMYAISAIIGLIGAIKVYSKWNSGDPDTQKVAAAWFGACIFLVIVATVIKTFFGLA